MADLDAALDAALERAFTRVLAPILAKLDELAAGQPVTLATVQEAAKHLGKSPATVRRMCANGTLPGAVRLGNSWRVDLGKVRP